MLPLLFIACATAPPPPAQRPSEGPRGLRASEHLAVAHEHEELARRTTRGSSLDEQLYRTWDTASDHARLAQIHRAEAAALETAYAEACGMREYDQIVTSPLVQHGLGVEATKTGAIVYLDGKAGAPVTVLADLRCHRAWMMLSPSAAMADCPLDVRGLRVDVRGGDDSIVVVLSVPDPKLVPELQRRTAKQLEGRSHLH